MTSLSAQLFTRKDLDRIAAAVKEAEGKTSGELVPYVVDRSDEYDEAELRATIAGGILPLVVILIIQKFTSLWLTVDTPDVLLVTLACMLAGWGAANLFPSVKRLLAGQTLLARRVAQRAAEAFISEEVFATRDRTGILLFISVLEHRVVVLGDAGINAHVQQEEWNDVVGCVTRGLRSGRVTEGIVEAIALCGTLLKKRGVEHRPTDINELPDSLRTAP